MNSSSAIIAGGNPWPHSRPYSALELAAHLHPMNLFEAQRTGCPPKGDPNMLWFAETTGKKEGRGTPPVSDNSLFERVAAVAEHFISRLTLEFASGQIVLRMNARSPSLSINVRITPGLA